MQFQTADFFQTADLRVEKGVHFQTGDWRGVAGVRHYYRPPLSLS